MASRIDLTNAPYIDLTHPTPGPDSTSRRSLARGDGEANNNNDDGKVLDQWSIVPSPKTEPTIAAKLAGNSSSGFVELSGWAMGIPLKIFEWSSIVEVDSCHFTYFINIFGVDFAEMANAQGDIVPQAKNMLDKCISLRELSDLIGGPQKIVNCPICVQVIAKRKVDVVVAAANQKVNLIPLVVVADKTGYCVICSFNEGVATIYNALEVGDQVLISRCMPQRPYRTYHKGLFSDDMFLNMEIKLQYFSVRTHFRRKFDPRKLSDFKITEDIFGQRCELKLPCELEMEFENKEKAPWVTPTPSECYYDIVGVVNYVGRIERYGVKDPLEIQCLVDGEVKSQNVTRYIPYRWVYLVDQTSKPLPVKIFLHNTTMCNQDTLVPGAITVFSHCQTHVGVYEATYATTSAFTQIYLGASVEKYYMIHPTTFRNKTGQLLIRANYIEIMTRKDIPWTVGGTHNARFSSEEKFRQFYEERQQPLFADIPSEFPLRRRESRRLYFEGRILRVVEVFDENVPTVLYMSSRYKQLISSKQKDYKILENFQSFDFYKNTSWYSFVRKLPEFDPKILQEEKCRDMVKKIVSYYKQFCGPLLFPAEMSSDPPGNLPKLADLEPFDGPPYLLLDIVNEDTKHWNICIWKAFDYNHLEMVDKVNAVQDKKVICTVEVYCTEPEVALEVNLQDFVVLESQ